MEVMCIPFRLDYYILCAFSPTNLIQASLGDLGSHVLRTAEPQDGRNLGPYIMAWKEATGQLGTAF